MKVMHRESLYTALNHYGACHTFFSQASTLDTFLCRYALATSKIWSTPLLSILLLNNRHTFGSKIECIALKRLEAAALHLSKINLFRSWQTDFNRRLDIHASVENWLSMLDELGQASATLTKLVFIKHKPDDAFSADVPDGPCQIQILQTGSETELVTFVFRKFSKVFLESSASHSTVTTIIQSFLISRFKNTHLHTDISHEQKNWRFMPDFLKRNKLKFH